MSCNHPIQGPRSRTKNSRTFPFHYYFGNFPCWLEMLFNMSPSSFITDLKALQMNKVKITCIYVKTYTSALHLKQQCSSRPVNSHRIIFLIPTSMDIISFLVSLTSKRPTEPNLNKFDGLIRKLYAYIETNVSQRQKGGRGKKRKYFP